MILALSYLDLLLEWWLPVSTPSVIYNNAGWLSELFPNDLASPLSWILPFDAAATRLVVAVVFALATAGCWLAVRRWAPPRIGVWRFVAALVVWPVASFGFSMAVVTIGGLIYRYSHGG